MTEQSNVETIEIVDTNFVQFVFKLQTAIQAGWVVNPDGKGIRDIGARKRAVLIRNASQGIQVKDAFVDEAKEITTEEASKEVSKETEAPKQTSRKTTAKKGD